MVGRCPAGFHRQLVHDRVPCREEMSRHCEQKNNPGLLANRCLHQLLPFPPSWRVRPCNVLPTVRPPPKDPLNKTHLFKGHLVLPHTITSEKDSSEGPQGVPYSDIITRKTTEISRSGAGGPSIHRVTTVFSTAYCTVLPELSLSLTSCAGEVILCMTRTANSEHFGSTRKLQRLKESENTQRSIRTPSNRLTRSPAGETLESRVQWHKY